MPELKPVQTDTIEIKKDDDLTDEDAIMLENLMNQANINDPIKMYFKDF